VAEVLDPTINENVSTIVAKTGISQGNSLDLDRNDKE
jgi:hypothetical protein